MVVEGLLYTKDHEWAKIEAEIATIGITDYAQQMLGEIVFVELPAIGKEFAGNDELAVVESTVRWPEKSLKSTANLNPNRS